MNEPETNNKTLPPEVKLMIYVLLKNGMWPVNETTYTKGKSMDDPIVIDIEGVYVRAEYLVAGFLLHPKKNKFTLQSLFNKGDRHYDELTYEVTEEDGTVHMEHFFFDITVGYNALSRSKP